MGVRVPPFAPFPEFRFTRTHGAAFETRYSISVPGGDNTTSETGRVGLCADCRYMRRVESARGPLSIFARGRPLIRTFRNIHAFQLFSVPATSRTASYFRCLVINDFGRSCHCYVIRARLNLKPS